MVDIWQTILRYNAIHLTLFRKSQIWSKTPNNILKIYLLKWSNNWFKDTTKLSQTGMLGATCKTIGRDLSRFYLGLWSV